jgi:hypothetical protein
LCPHGDQWLKTNFANHPSVVERDDGGWSIGWHGDAPGPFTSRAFVAALAAQQARQGDIGVRQ